MSTQTKIKPVTEMLPDLPDLADLSDPVKDKIEKAIEGGSDTLLRLIGRERPSKRSRLWTAAKIGLVAAVGTITIRRKLSHS